MSEHETRAIQKVALSQIFSDDEFNCRGAVMPIDVDELAKSMDKYGLMQPIIIQPWKGDRPYRIIVGHRRYKAAKLLRWESIDVIIRPDLTDVEAALLNIMENVHRQQLNIHMEAKAVSKLLNYGLTPSNIGKLLRKSATWVSARLDLMTLPEDIQNEAAAGFLNIQQIRDLASLPKDKLYEVYRTIKDAKIRSDARVLQPKKKPKPPKDVCAQRDRQQVFDMQDLIRSRIGNCLATRVLGWVAGTVPDSELMADIEYETNLLAEATEAALEELKNEEVHT